MIRVINGMMHVVERLQDLMPRVIAGERPGMVVNMANGTRIVDNEEGDLRHAAENNPDIVARNHIYDQVLSRIMDGSAPLDQAIDDPRLHCSIGATISREAERFDAATIAGLKDAGYEVDPRDAYAFYLRCVQAVPRRQSGMVYQPQPPDRSRWLHVLSPASSRSAGWSARSQPG